MAIIPFCQHYNPMTFPSWLKYLSFPFNAPTNILWVLSFPARQNIRVKRGRAIFKVELPQAALWYFKCIVSPSSDPSESCYIIPRPFSHLHLSWESHCSFYTGWVLDRNCPKGRVMMECMFYFCLALSSRVDVAIKHLKNNYLRLRIFFFNFNSFKLKQPQVVSGYCIEHHCSRHFQVLSVLPPHTYPFYLSNNKFLH